jgi:hypothetical protein
LPNHMRRLKKHSSLFQIAGARYEGICSCK